MGGRGNESEGSVATMSKTYNIEREGKLRRRYGITVDDYERMFYDQGGVCAICETPKAETLSVDHCHTTLKVRGLLCNQCNRGMGLLGDDVDNLARAIAYLEDE